MSAEPAAPPELPPFIAAQLPWRRRLVTLRHGPEAGRRLHLIDEGDAAAPVVVLVHGNPTWSFLWRRVIGELPGLRSLAPDLLGLGFSERLPRLADHTLERHATAIAELLDELAIERCVLVGQDWGGPVAAAVGARRPERVAAAVFANTAIIVPHAPRGTLFHRLARVPILSDLIFRGLGFPQNALHLAQGDRRSIRGDVARAYRWPLRRFTDRVAPLALARMVPDGPRHPSLAELRRGEAWVRDFAGPLALVWGMRDPILGRALSRHEKSLPRARVERTAAGHFLQEEVPDVLAQAIRQVVDEARL